MFYLEHFGITDAGKVRENNEDSLLVASGEDETLFAVADGIGGFEAGEVASRLAVGVLEKIEPNDSFDGAVKEANRRIRAASKGDETLAGMGTTVVAIRFGGTRQKPVAEVAHVGDSRAYLLRDGELKPVTEDHSLVAELVKSGDLTRAEAAEHPQKNLITRALGAEESITTDTSTMTVKADDRFLLCSDGLSDMVKEARIKEVLADERDPEPAARRLLSDALEAGGSDNITIVVIDVRDRGEKNRDGSRGTREMQAVGRAAAAGAAAPSAFAGTRRGKRSRNPQKSRGSGIGRLLGGLVRGVAVLAVLALAVTPVYLWGSSRFFLDADGGEIVAYRGLPYTVAGTPLNEEWRRTGLTIEEVEPPYRDPINDNTYYEQEGIERVLDQMEADARQERQQRQESQDSQNNDDPASSEGRGN